jgi:hypothetical protein
MAFNPSFQKGQDIMIEVLDKKGSPRTLFRRKVKGIIVAGALLTAGVLSGCGGSSNDAVPTISSVSNPSMYFNRVASFPVCSQTGSSCESSTETAAEITAASTDGMTLIYTNSPAKQIGFIDITNPAAPMAKGSLAMTGEPTSVAVLDKYALTAVNTSADFVNTSGILAIVDIDRQTVSREIALPGQPDSVTVSKDGKYAAIVIENERDEDLGTGAPPQLPAGCLVIVDTVGTPDTWTTRQVDLTGVATLYPTDPEPEYVDINDDNIAVVTLQENNHIVLVDLASGKVTGQFSAGTFNLTNIDTIDERPNLITLSTSKNDIKREPDGVTWLSTTRFVTANEGDLDGGSRGFTIFSKDGAVVYDAGNTLEHAVARIGHYPDRRSDAKGNEPENVEFSRFEGTDYLFVASERSSIVAVYDMSNPDTPSLKQMLPAGMGPEGILAIPKRNLLIASSEEDSREDGFRSVVNIYQYQKAAPAYPTLVSADRPDGTPIPWGAMSGLAAGATDAIVYGVHDAFYCGSRIYTIDRTKTPPVITSEIVITDPNGKIPALAATLPDADDPNTFDDTDLPAMTNADGTVNFDVEGISVASTGGFWLTSEGSGTVGDKKYPVKTGNLIVKVDSAGVIEEIIMLPAALNALQQRFGLEGIAESDGKLIVALQRPWAGETNPRIGVYDLAAKTWKFMYYPLDLPVSPNGGWVGLSEITALGSNRFLVVERDNQGGPDARIKRIYRIDLTGKADGDTLSKVLVRDLIDDLKAPGGHIIEKVEGLAVVPGGDAMIITDNDGLDDNSGETQFINLGKIQ